MKDEIKAQFTTDNFLAWLGQFRKRQIVGRSYSPEKRPLAKFMTEQVGEKTKVMPVRSRVGDVSISNPGWAREFIHEIDKSEPEYIQKARAIDTLTKILE